MTQNEFKHTCRECHGPKFGETCPFCEACDKEGIVNGRNKHKRNARRREL